jgi:hypothetical protein
MKIIVFILMITILCSCNNSAVSKKLAASDSLVITFNIPENDSAVKTVSTTEKTAIRKLVGFMDGKKAEAKQCGYDGNFTFYSKGQLLLPVIFKYTKDGCRVFMFELDNKVINTTMSTEAVDFLTSLADGKGSY